MERIFLEKFRSLDIYKDDILSILCVCLRCFYFETFTFRQRWNNCNKNSQVKYFYRK